MDYADLSLGLNSLEAMATLSGAEGRYKGRIEAVKESCAIIYKKYKKREEEISLNGDKYMPDKVLDMQFNLRRSVRQTLEELLKSRSFLSEIESVQEDLEKEAPKTEIQQLEQTMKEIELRKLMRSAGQDFLMQFKAAIVDGDPLTVESVSNSPVPFPIDPGLLDDGKKRRREILRPVAAKKLNLLLKAQGTIEGMINQMMPIKRGDIDPIKDIVDSMKEMAV